MAGAGEKDAKAGMNDERTTERRMATASAVMHAAADSTRDVTGEDFLFHLYRGSELLQDNRVLEAKEELEHALTLQPRDPKGQDLLAVVYFRIGHYPRAIQIYEQLKRDNPRDAALKLNLALCYLKTGQAQPARFELEDVVRLHPTHKRAWGYLGLAHERLGDLEKAMSAFERGGHAHMVRRIADKIGASRARTPTAPAADAAVRATAAAAFEELDAGEISFSLAEPTTGSRVESTNWRTHEPGAPAPRRSADGWTVPPTAEAVASMRAEEIAASQGPAPAPPLPTGTATPPQPPSLPARAAHAPPPLAVIARAARLEMPLAPGVLLHPSGVALVRTGSGNGNGDTARPFAARLESIRAQTGALATEILPRLVRGKSTGESFGGASSPIVRLEGAGEIVVSPRPSHLLVGFTLSNEEVLTLREDVILGFELAALAHESGKLALGDGESVQVVQFRSGSGGGGVVLLELLTALEALELVEGRALLVRRDSLLGWSGRAAPRALTPVEAPGGQRGLLSFTGEGTILLSSG